MKELWEVRPEVHRQGQVTHTLGWPLSSDTGGGSFMYHLEDNLVAIGFVVHLNYENPYLYPYMEFQRFKHHPLIEPVLEAGGASPMAPARSPRAGCQSVPRLCFPGGALIGCSAGFVNVPRIKGSHNAMKTGMLAAESAFAALQAGRAGDELEDYQTAFEGSSIHRTSRRCATSSRYGRSWALSGGLRQAASTCGPTRFSGCRCSAP